VGVSESVAVIVVVTVEVAVVVVVAKAVTVDVADAMMVGVSDGVGDAVSAWDRVGVGVALGYAVFGVQDGVKIGVGVGVSVMLSDVGDGRMVFAMVAVVDDVMVADGLCVGSGAPLAADADWMEGSPSQK